MRTEYVIHQVRKLRKERGSFRITKATLAKKTGINVERIHEVESFPERCKPSELRRTREAVDDVRSARRKNLKTTVELARREPRLV